jgi:EAL domain-containing protein (putative c-di-GMP-specific phosphodiesterase class I)
MIGLEQSRRDHEAHGTASLSRGFSARLSGLAGGTPAALQGVLDRAEFTPWFQPIVDLRTAQTVAFEALTRFRDGTPPADRFRLAGEVGLSEELELRTLTAAVEAAGDLPSGAALHLNVSPRVLTQSPGLGEILRGCPRQVVLELTEHDPTFDCGILGERLRGLGPVMLAVDDVGSGYASLAHILALAPNYVKLGAGLVAGMSTDPVRRSLLAGLNYFVDQLESELIAEGVETELDLRVLVDLGVGLAQGYFLGRPAEARTWHVCVPCELPQQNLGLVVAPARRRAVTDFPDLLPRTA